MICKKKFSKVAIDRNCEENDRNCFFTIFLSILIYNEKLNNVFYRLMSLFIINYMLKISSKLINKKTNKNKQQVLKNIKIKYLY